ncbi:MAG: hypothetical protein J6U64_05050, partial [Alphaproteobacteria bacterium]|nr:hypothetical protein [Alphaproteobacteria bacterium]
MFEKPWNSVKRMLLTGLCLTALLAPYEAEAAPKNRKRSERISKKARREAERQNKQRQRRTPKPTFEENLSPAQINRKIQTIRRGIETAPENLIPSKDKRVLLEVFDDIIQTPMGRYTFEKAHPDLNFCVRKFSSTASASYSPGKMRINLRRGLFDDIHNAKTQEERLQNFHYLTENIIHEATHSVQQINNLKTLQKASFKERMIINNMGELHTFLNESVAGYQITTLPKYRSVTQNGKLKLSPISQFYKELFEA